MLLVTAGLYDPDAVCHRLPLLPTGGGTGKVLNYSQGLEQGPESTF